MYWRYLSKKHFIGIVECFSKFFILHRERSLLYKLFWCFCPRKIALLRNWCQIRFLLSLYKSLNTIRNVFIDAMRRDGERIIFGDIFLRKSFLPNSIHLEKLVFEIGFLLIKFHFSENHSFVFQRHNISAPWLCDYWLLANFLNVWLLKPSK